MVDRLSPWDVSLNQAKTFALGAVVAGSSQDVQFRVRNESDLYTAAGVVVSLVGTDANDCFLSADGYTFVAEVELGDMPPSVTSEVLTLRRVTASGTSGDKSCSLRLTTTGWAF